MQAKTKVSHAIILAAGQGFSLDGINKVLIVHPKSGKTILEHALEAFSGKKITVVVGFRAIKIMEKFPHLDYVINPDWALTNNAMSLGLALSNEPCYVVSGDIFFEKKLIDALDNAPDNLVLTQNRENRTLSAIHCVTNEENEIIETYQGPVRSAKHPESVGLFKISDALILREWKKRCITHSNLFVGQTLPCELINGEKIIAQPLNENPFDEINTAADYLRFIQKSRA